MVHIVGAPSQAAQDNGELLHHTLGDGSFSHFLRMHQEIAVATSVLTAGNAAAEIDRVLLSALTHRRPVYLLLATNVGESPLSPPDQPLTLTAGRSSESLAAFADAAETLLAAAGSAAMLADFLADRAGQQQRLHDWLTDVPMPFATLLMGKVCCQKGCLVMREPMRARPARRVPGR